MSRLHQGGAIPQSTLRNPLKTNRLPANVHPGVNFLDEVMQMMLRRLIHLLWTLASQITLSSAPRAAHQRGFSPQTPLLAVLMAVLCSHAYAQSEATITGILADPSGAGIPGASLSLTNQDTTAVVGTQKSDVGGNFSFQAVPAPGAY